jgi:hypothetical protein
LRNALSQMALRQIANADALNAASAELTTMREVATRFRGLLRGGTVAKFGGWMSDARQSGGYGMQRFARGSQHDIDAVRNAVLEPWSNRQTEGRINRLKTLERTMYGRAVVDLLRARLMPLKDSILRRKGTSPMSVKQDKIFANTTSFALELMTGRAGRVRPQGGVPRVATSNRKTRGHGRYGRILSAMTRPIEPISMSAAMPRGVPSVNSPTSNPPRAPNRNCPVPNRADALPAWRA